MAEGTRDEKGGLCGVFGIFWLMVVPLVLRVGVE